MFQTEHYTNTSAKGMLKMGAIVRAGAAGVMYWTVQMTSYGPMVLAASEMGVCALAFIANAAEGEAALRRRYPRARLIPAGEAFGQLIAAVHHAVEHPGEDSSAIPLDVHGTPFQQRVWEALRQIPPGETRSYGELAAALGNPKASRAVGGANGANHIAVLIPCHRVIAADGTLGGYAYGLEIKAELLRREGR
jgi:AraC family transcriptional regulator of adaptative response/methylated-DNA-[protein]-cysteine methyltransferase